MGRAQQVVVEALQRELRPEPEPEAMRTGPRQAQPDGSVTVIEGWEPMDQAPEEAPVVDRSPLRVTD